MARIPCLTGFKVGFLHDKKLNPYRGENKVQSYTGQHFRNINKNNMKLAVLDKDGTLVLPKSGNTFVQNPTDQVLMVGAIEGCQRLIDAGYVLAIASNQGGIAAKHKSIDETILEMRYCLQMLKDFEIEVNRALFCPDFEGTNCIAVDLEECYDLRDRSPIWLDLTGGFRKPLPGMLFGAIEDKCQRTDTWMIGDREEDRLAAEAAGFNFLDADEWRKGASPWII